MASTPDFIERRHLPARRVGDHPASEQHMKAVEWIPMVLLVAGGLNWGLVGLFDFNLVSYLFGQSSAVTRAVYAVVGLSALYSLYMSTRLSRHHQ